MISLEEMKNYLRVDGNEDDELIQNLLNLAYEQPYYLNKVSYLLHY